MLPFLIVSLIMFFAGIYGFFTRKNLILMLISIELILNAVDLNFAVFNRYLFPGEMEQEALCFGALSVLKGEEEAKIY